MMKKIHKFNRMAQTSVCVLLLTLFVLTSAFCQAPGTFNYQAVLRDASGAVRADASVSVKLSILKSSATGTSVYSETHSVTTNNLGLISLKVGSKNTAGFGSIDWASGPYFIKTEVDGTELGTSQLLSVPYALYAAKAVSAGGITGTLSTDSYSAYDDLEEEDKLNSDDSKDLLTRAQGDSRYSPNLSFFARNSATDNYTVNETKVEFNDLVSGTDILYLDKDDKYLAFFKGVYHFSATVALANLETDAIVTLGCYVNGDNYYRLSSCTAGGSTITLNGSLSLELNIGDYVEIKVYSSDANFSVIGGSDLSITHFSGHLVHRIF